MEGFRIKECTGIMEAVSWRESIPSTSKSVSRKSEEFVLCSLV